MNKYIGTTPIDIEGQQLTLAFTWDAIARVREELGDDGQAKALAGDLEALSVLVAIGLSKHHGDWTADKVRVISPPVYPTTNAVEVALTAAYFGPNGVPEDQEPENPKVPLLTRLKRLWQRRTE